MNMPKIWCAVVAAVALAGCHSPSDLDRRYAPARANLPEVELPNERPPAPLGPMVNPEPTNRSPAQPPQEVITGTWTFTAPPTVTQTEKKNGQIMQYAIYAGRPAANDLPIVVITVGPPPAAGAPQGQAEGDPATYKIAATRTYTLNGNLATEWTGTASTGSAFSELLLKRPGASDSSDVCHAMATARNAGERKIALDILSSLTWKPAGQ